MSRQNLRFFVRKLDFPLIFVATETSKVFRGFLKYFAASGLKSAPVSARLFRCATLNSVFRSGLSEIFANWSVNTSQTKCQPPKSDCLDQQTRTVSCDLQCSKYRPAGI